MNDSENKVTQSSGDGGYNFRAIEQKWQQHWNNTGAYKVENNSSKPKYYVLDMFPYPSGAGLHVGHPLGYIASDIIARYKRLKGFNVLHPMGYDAFGLPAEQYAIEHGVHPAVSTAKNIETFRSQLDKIGFSFDWSREVNTSQPQYYKWTQWIFLQLFKSWYNRKTNKTEPVAELIKIFEAEGNVNHPVPEAKFEIRNANFEVLGGKFSAAQWKTFDEKTQQAILMEYRIAYCGYGEVNWCEALGTVLANDEVVNGVSERGGHPVIKKRLRQWYLRITEYADRLLQGLQTVDFSDAMKEMQSNWIGKSSGAEIEFNLTPNPSPTELERGAVPYRYGEGLSDDEFLVEEAYPKYGINDRVQFENARVNRKNSTQAEAKLWELLRDGKLGCKFRRQHPVDGFITDFACLQKGLIVEVDGGYHNTPEQQQHDVLRETILKQKSFTILRFTNDEVLENVFVVKEKIKNHLQTLEQETSNRLQEDAASYGIRNGNQPISDPTSPLSSSAGEGLGVRCYTTRPDTIFGVDFLVLAPEHELVAQITTAAQKPAVEEYIAYVKSRSERERMAEKKISGVFTGAYAINPLSGAQIPVWLSEYVLAGYGTGAIMAVPSGDERDHKFARHFNLPITNIIGDAYNGQEANATKDAVLTNSGFLNGMVMRDASEVVIQKLEELGAGKRKVNYKMRDAAFSRQRYWGEPFPIKWIDGVAYALDESELPLQLPKVENYKPGPEGEGPLANIPEWYLTPNPSPRDLERGAAPARLETNTMPGYAGSSWYFLRYMDPHNDETFCDRNVSDYWRQVDLYVGGTEHAVGHLLYSRMWTKALYDLGLISFDEPFKKLLNQGMITGVSQFAYKPKIITSEKDEVEARANYVQFIDANNHLATVTFSDEAVGDAYEIFYSVDVAEEVDRLYKVMFPDSKYGSRFIETRLPVTHISQGEVNYHELYDHNAKYFNAVFATKSGFYHRGYFCLYDNVKDSSLRKIKTKAAIEKMSKSKLNVVNPSDIVFHYGADTFRMYEMFLGPVEMSKPWDTKGIEGVHRFLKKLWRLFNPETAATSPLASSAGEGAGGEVKALHRTIKKIEDDMERFSFNTSVSAFMVCVNELTDLKCHKKEILEPLLILLAPFAPHIAEELWQQLGNKSSVLDAAFPKFNPAYLEESTKEYPVSINGKLRTTLMLDLSATQEQVQEIVMQNPVVQKWIEGKEVKKFIFVKNKMVNVVV